MTTPSFQPLAVALHFGSKVDLSEAGAWKVLSASGIARVDEARELADPVVALGEFLRANCRMFAEMDHGRRIDSLQRLTARLIDGGHIKPEWTHDQVVDALGVLTNVETFESLNRHRGRSWQQIADLLFEMSAAFRTH